MPRRLNERTTWISCIIMNILVGVESMVFHVFNYDLVYGCLPVNEGAVICLHIKFRKFYLLQWTEEFMLKTNLPAILLFATIMHRHELFKVVHSFLLTKGHIKFQ